MKRLGGIVDADASIMAREAVRMSVTSSFLDEAVSVRQVASYRRTVLPVVFFSTAMLQRLIDVIYIVVDDALIKGGEFGIVVFSCLYSVGCRLT